MKKWLPRIALLLVLVGLGFWVWRTFFPDPRIAIRRRLAEIAELAGFDSHESPTAKLWNAQKLASFFTEDVTIKVDVPGVHGEFEGRDQIASAAAGVRQHYTSMTARFSELQITLSADGKSATAELTVNASASGEPDFILQELALRLKKIGRTWFISRVETVKTLR